MMKNHELLFRHRELGIGPAMIVSELDLEVVGIKTFNNRADLTTIEIASWNVLREGDHVEQLNGTSHDWLL